MFKLQMSAFAPQQIFVSRSRMVKRSNNSRAIGNKTDAKNAALARAGELGTPAADAASELESLIAWVEAFKQEHGRPLRVLHLGNIAGNAYLNCKFLRSVGVDADVVCNDYNHVMAMPEWEDLELRYSHGDDFNPEFHRSDVAGFSRPDWYISGPLAVCVEEVNARYPVVDPLDADRISRRRSQWRAKKLAVAKLNRRLSRAFGTTAATHITLALTRPRVFATKVAAKLVGILPLSDTRKASTLHRISAMGAGRAGAANTFAISKNLCRAFDKRFPDRTDKLTEIDTLPYLAAHPDYELLFAPYDIVQCYATEPIKALMTGKRPYVAFEHGTLRHFTTDDNPLHRLTALAYREADHTFITNGDCLAYAKNLGIEDYSAIIHPVNVDQHRQDFSEDADRIRKELKADILIYCPIRHDYGIKGTDLAIKALPLIKARTDKRVVMIMSTWGAQVAESRVMIKELGCEDNVAWRGSMSRVAMIKHIQAADVVFDQFVLPVFGSTAPQTIAAGKPVLASYVPAETAWLIPEPAPIVSAYTPEEIAEKTIMCLDPEWLRDYQVRARDWIDRYHSPRNVLLDHLRVYRNVLQKHQMTD